LSEHWELLEQMHICTVQPHEFLYLVVNASNRLSHILTGHKVEHKSKILNLQNEFKYEQAKDFNLHLLSKNAFENNAPHHLVNQGLDRSSIENSYKFVGGLAANHRATDQNFSQFYHKVLNRNFQTMDFGNKEQPDEIRLFLGQRYDKSNFTVK